MSQLKHKFTITLLGNAGVGKTSIKKRILGKKFDPNELTTVGANFSQTNLRINGDTKKIRICDVAGQSSVKSVKSQLMSRSDAAFLIFDLTLPVRYETLITWIKDYLDANNNKNRQYGQPPILIVGNKVDLADDRKIALSEIEKFLEMAREDVTIQNHLIGYNEVSAKTGENIDKVVGKLVNNIKVITTNDVK